MLPRLRALADKYEVIGDVRGRGAMLAVELVEPAPLSPNPMLATAAVSAACHRRGADHADRGTYGNVLRFLPPLVIGDDLLHEGLDILDGAFAAPPEPLRAGCSADSEWQSRSWSAGILRAVAAALPGKGHLCRSSCRSTAARPSPTPSGSSGSPSASSPRRRDGNDVVVVVSAMGDTTDELIDLAKQIVPVPDGREFDMLLTAGERISMALLAMAINSLGYTAESFTGSQAGVLTTSVHGKARIVDITPGRIESLLPGGQHRDRRRLPGLLRKRP